MTAASPSALAPDLEAALDRAIADTDAQVSRTDNKASLLLAFDGAALAGLASVADTPLPALGTLAGAAAIGALSVSAVLLLLVVRPHLRDDDHGSFPYWSTLTGDDQVRAAVTSSSKETRLRALSGIALRKYTRLRRAVDVSLAALALLALAAACAAW
ncbi:Pycsar system effector family protein [Streptomyces sp. NPDC088197]|uniref:Pycsar system effector family protein n=1 Tax=Streptomyces sp. NPDC088197 TaxID=3365840 RepID=UPI003804AFE4